MRKQKTSSKALHGGRCQDHSERADHEISTFMFMYAAATIPSFPASRPDAARAPNTTLLISFVWN